MEVVKRNMYSIICGVFALIAVIMVFYPLGGWFEDLQGKLEESGSDYSTARSLLSKEHTAPNVDIENAEQRRLDRFPTPKVIAAGEAAVTKVQDQSLALLEEAMKMNRKEPLVPTALPVQRTGAAFSDFKIQYYGKLHDFVKRLNATHAPTQEEVERRLEIIRNEMAQNAGVGGDFGRADIENELRMKELTIPDEMARDRAARATIYISGDPGGSGHGSATGETPELIGLKSFDVHHPGIPTRSQQGHPTLIDVWAAQMGLWIQQDVVEALVATNGTTPGIEKSVVKRLIEIKIPKEYVTKLGRVVLADSTGSAVRYDPSAAPPVEGEEAPIDDAGKPPKDVKQSPTGRIGNDMYDVVHFSVTVDADATRFRDFMAHLVNNRHITILSIDLEGVDRDAEFQALYLYGDNPVVRLRLNCEALFFRNWTLPLMPEQVKKMLNIQPPVEGGTDSIAMP